MQWTKSVNDAGGLSVSLGEEEAGWVDYSAAEFDVKVQLVDSLMELMLNDTVQTIQQAMHYRQMITGWW